MPRIKITMEAEVGDLRSFCDKGQKKIDGVTKLNVATVVNEMKMVVLSKLMDMYANQKKTPAPTFRALKKHLTDERVLTERLMDTIKIEEA